MRFQALALVAALALAGCGISPTTPLGHALVALRAGDRDAFLVAKAEADAAVKSGWQAGGDVCNLQAADLENHGEAALIDKLDHPDLFKLPEEQRFVYAAHVAGKWASPMMEGQAWGETMLQDAAGHTNGCDDETMMQKMIFYGQAPSEKERIALMDDWQDSLHDHYGDAGYAPAMHDAYAALDRNGFTAEYPLALELGDPEANGPTTTFADVQKKVGK